uniref:Proteasome subunit alpha type n=1 Tax=Caligus rogercresseyi TaxID=217165 RepID=C1BMT3_CALRO|nr:Proteasome subunit alpha type-1 [Caligus rogercresseyi]|eukprot:TRINITY_DN368_c0_g1_i2.p1 TRINITY_DN368_c0_g1~~TRINITY_DN368_c0_g1_i2.p1  ORF type:complete len:270 (+),score=102.08 TRINITY_DN368_c0_g1_i2:145-954(+)
MFRNQYDSDVTTWSPQGRLFQVEYATEAVKQGSVIVGLKNSSDYAVIVSYSRAPTDLSYPQKKIMTLDTHVGVAMAGLTADAKSLCRWMRTECNYSSHFKDSPIRINVLMQELGHKMQLCIQGYNKRPYGVGFLVAGFDDLGPHIYQTCPSANFFECKAMAIGARSQSARTYLEKHMDSFPEADLESLIKHGLLAARDTLPNEVDLSRKNTSIAVVGKNKKFTVIENEAVDPYLANIEGERRGGGNPPAAPAADAPSEEGPEGGAMDTD